MSDDRTARVLHAGAQHSMMIARRIRGELWLGLLELAADEEAMSELFDGPDVLAEEHVADYAAAARAYLRGAVRGGTDERRLWIGASYPVSDAQMPWIGVVTESGGEDPGQTVIGDVLHATHQKLGRDVALFPDASEAEIEDDDPLPDGASGIRFTPSIRRLVRGTGATEQVQVTIWHPVTEIAELLDAACKRVLFLRKTTLQDVGGLSMDLSWTGIQPDQRLYPRIAWVPTIRCTVHHHLVYTERTGPVPTGVRFRAGRFGGSSES